MPNIIFIPADNSPKYIKPTLVAAYCRVSTLQEIQHHSLATQREFYKKHIESHDNWKFVGIYSDQASGRCNKKMKDFQRMLEDCRSGKINKILVKSISRLGRNTLEFLRAVDFFNDYSIDVYFEIENLHCYEQEAINSLTLFAALYQQESETKSFNTRWGHHVRFEDCSSGMYNRPCYGYIKSKDETLEIDTEKAEVVIRIFAYRAAGLSLRKIATALMNDNIPAPRGGNKWGVETVRTILNNEKYYGIVMLGKTYISDYFSGKQSVNRGEMPKYVMKNHHPPILGPDFRNVYDFSKM